MSKRSGIRESGLKLIAGAPADVPFNGNYIRLSSALYPVLIEIDGNDTFKLSPGEDIVFQDGASFERLRLTTIAPIDDLITLAIGTNVKVGSARVSGSVVVSNSPQLGGGSLDQIVQPVKAIFDGQSYNDSWATSVSVGANSTQVVFTAAENVNGVVIHDLRYFSGHNSNTPVHNVFIAKADAPSSEVDGDVILSADTVVSLIISGRITAPLKIAAGLGLYYYAKNTETSSYKMALFTKL